MTQKGQNLTFRCPSCGTAVPFSILNLEKQGGAAKCDKCHTTYAFGDPNLKRQLKKFEALCRQIAESEEILADTAVGIDVAGHHVKVPFKLLLTRFNNSLDLNIGDERVTIEFRLEPLKDVAL